MIKSCNEIETIEDFREFSNHTIRIGNMGLIETEEMLRWSFSRLIRPSLFSILIETNRRIKND